MKKRVIAVWLMGILLCKFILFPNVEVFLNAATAPQEQKKMFDVVSERLPQAATDYVKSSFDNIIVVAKGFKDELGIEINDLDNVSLSEPFVIYDYDVVKQQEEYYYPIVNNNTKQVVLVVEVVGTTVGWQHSFNTHLVDELNQINWPQKDYIFTETQGKVTIEKISLEDTRNSLILNSVDGMEKINVEENVLAGRSNTFGSYIPTVTDELGYYYCNLNNAVGQGDYNICWAATVATIINYIQGTNLSAFNVCDAIGHTYTGGTTTDTKKALKHYGYNYVYRDRDLYFKTIMSNIQKKKPIALFGNAEGQSMGHVVTIYGFRDLSNGKYILIWDSAEEKVSIVNYNEMGTTFASGGVTYTWARSLSFK